MSLIKNLVIDTVEKLAKVKEQIYHLKQGEALERTSTPLTTKESASLGDFGPRVNIIGNTVKTIELQLNYLASPSNGPLITDTSLATLIDNIFRASASKGAKRLTLIGETLQNVKPAQNFPTQDPLKIEPGTYDEIDDDEE